MNEWLNKTPDTLQAASSISPASLFPHLNQMVDESTNPNKHLSGFGESPSQRGGNAKKRWLRQAISEDHSSDGPIGRPGIINK